METAIKSLETTLAERNAMVRILQSKNSASNLAVNNLEDFIASKMMHQQATPHSAVATPSLPNENVLSIAIANSSPHKKQFSTPSVLATPPQYHSLNLSKKLGHAHRSLTPSGDMFLKANNDQMMRSTTPSADFLSALSRATPSHADLMRSEYMSRATPTSAELHRLSAPADMLRAGAPSAEMLRATPTSMADYMSRATPTSMGDYMVRATPTSVAEMQMRVSVANEMLMRQAAVAAATPTHFDMLRATPPTSDSLYSNNPSMKRREPSGTSTAEAFQHPGPT